MPPVKHGSAAPFLRYLANKSNYNPLPLGVRPLFYVQYGQWRSAYSKGYERKKLSSLSTIHKLAVLRWREFLAYYEPAANWADRGLLFNPNGEWPSKWPDDWPPWVTPIHLLRAFGGSNRCAKYSYSQYLYKWTVRPGMPELFAYTYGVPLNRKEEAVARRGARSLLQTPQFNIYAPLATFRQSTPQTSSSVTAPRAGPPRYRRRRGSHGPTALAVGPQGPPSTRPPL
jgi:hypothetical protein